MKHQLSPYKPGPRPERSFFRWVKRQVPTGTWFQPRRKSLLSIGLSLTLSLTVVSPAQAGLIERITSIFRPNPELGNATGTRRGGGTRDFCEVPASEGEPDVVQPSSIDDLFEDDVVTETATSEDTENVQGTASLVAESSRRSDNPPVFVAFSLANGAPDPTSSAPENLLEGKTLSPHPRFGLYVPFSQKEDSAILELSIAENSGTRQFLVERLLFELPQEPGLVTISLPESQPGLQPNRVYYWTVSLHCRDEGADDENPSGVREVGGLISLTSDATFPSSSEEYAVYLENGIWYDMVAQLIAHRDQHPDEWSKFLEYFGLTDTADPELIPVLAPLSE